jgi:hypothetical protein
MHSLWVDKTFGMLGVIFPCLQVLSASVRAQQRSTWYVLESDSDYAQWVRNAPYHKGTLVNERCC